MRQAHWFFEKIKISNSLFFGTKTTTKIEDLYLISDVHLQFSKTEIKIKLTKVRKSFQRTFYSKTLTEFERTFIGKIL